MASNQSNHTSASTAGLNKTVDPIESFVFAGLQKKFIEVFEAPSIWVTSTDKTKAIQKLFGNVASGATESNIQYPYAFLTVASVSPSDSRGNIRALGLYGMTVSISDDQKRAYRAKLQPVDFTVTVEYVTNSYTDVLKFVNTWLFSRREGWLRFNVQYGLLSTSTSVVQDGNVSYPLKEADLGNVQEYTINATMVVESYISFAVLQEQQIVDTVVEENLISANQPILNTSTWSF